MAACFRALIKPLPDLSALETVLGHTFKNRALLTEALTHSSAKQDGAHDNERFEFLGDRVLGLCTAEVLLERFPGADEGDIAPRFNALVRKERCATVAQSIGLGEYILVSASETPKPGQPLKATILADACEAVLGALFLDGGLEKARAFIRSAWQTAYDDVETLPRDAKSALQEWTQDQGHGLPSYSEVGRTGPDHQPLFEVAVKIARKKNVMGKGPSKRAAEQTAAAGMLVQLGVWSDEERDRAHDLSSGT